MINFTVISNNVKGLQSNKKRLNIINYLKGKGASNNIMFLQETHSTSKDEHIWKDDFQGDLFFSHGTSNSRGVLVLFSLVYLVFKNLKLNINFLIITGAF